MGNYNQNSQLVTVFHVFPALEEGSTLAGYAALIEGHGLLVPAPDYLCAIGVNTTPNPQIFAAGYLSNSGSPGFNLLMFFHWKTLNPEN